MRHTLPDVDPIEAIVARLVARGIPHEVGGRQVVVSPRDETGFSVSLRTKGARYAVSFDGWHEHFATEKEALNCFSFGLTSQCRLRITRRWGMKCAWAVESKAGDDWHTDSETGLLIIPWWAAKTIEYRQNDWWRPS